jgi:hypothetical protein
VTDQGSLASLTCARMALPQPLPLVEAASAPPLPPSVESERDSGWVVCQICGRWGRWVNPFLFER